MSLRPVLLVLAAALLGAAGTASAQPALPDTLVWERVGDVENVDWLTFHADTLYAGTNTNSDLGRRYGIAVLRPGEDWMQGIDVYGAYDMGRLGETADDDPAGPVVYLHILGTIARSETGDHPFEDVFDDGVNTLPFRTPDGALIVSVNSATRPAARSTDGGRTWSVPDGPDLALTPTHFAIPGAAPSRVVGAGYGGIGYSDDGGQTWQPTAISGGGLAFAAWALARVEAGPHDGGHGGALLAVVEGNGTLPASVFRSADGAAWERIGPSPGGYGYTGRLVGAPDGAVYLYKVQFGRNDEDRSSDPVYRSVDGGATWASVGPVWTAWWAEPSEIVAGPDGRLWASATGRYVYGRRVGGVFRTVDPVFAVANEAPTPEAGALGLTVRPNPAASHAEVVLRLGAGAPPTEAVITVHDARGREVARLGGAVAGERTFRLDTSGWASGVYVVRGTAGTEAASASFTVAR